MSAIICTKCGLPLTDPENEITSTRCLVGKSKKGYIAFMRGYAVGFTAIEQIQYFLGVDVLDLGGKALTLHYHRHVCQPDLRPHPQRLRTMSETEFYQLLVD